MIRLSAFLCLLVGSSVANHVARLAETHGTVAEQQDEKALREMLAAEGIGLDLERGLVSIRADVAVRADLLEYLLVGAGGAVHESLFVTPVRPSLLNAAFLSLGIEPGQNARWEEVTAEGDADEGAEPERRLVLPTGDGLLMYAAWREGDEVYFYRVDDLIANLDSGRSMKRHRWVFLGSRFKRPRDGEAEVFVADLEQNLICLSFFYQGNTLLTGALPDCQVQTIWAANPWLVPPRNSSVRLIFAREPLRQLPDELRSALPVVEPVVDDAR